MRGAPFIGVACVLVAALLLFWPLQKLTRAPSAARVEVAAPPAGSERLTEAWLEITCSAAPTSIEIFQGERLLWKGGGALQLDADLNLDLSETRKPLQIHFRWPEDVEQAYAEFVLEPGAFPPQRQGFWSHEGSSRTWFLNGETAE